MVWIAIAVVLLMLLTSFSGAFYSSNSAASSGSSGSHIYLVTMTVGGQNSSYFEEVQNGKVVKTWPAPAAVSGGLSNGSSSGVGLSSALSTGSENLSSQANRLLEKLSNSSAASVDKNNSTSMDAHGSGSTFNVTQSYSLTSITLSPTSSNLYVGQTLLLKAIWSGGQSPYSYVWNVTQTSSDRVFASYYNNSSSFDLAEFNFTPDHPDTYLITLTVNGSTSGSGLSAGAVVSVQQQPQSHKDRNNQYSLQNVTLAPSTTVMYLGEPVTFVGNWTGSSTAYNYAWVVTTDQSQWKSYYKGDTNQINNYNVTTDTSTSFTFNPQYGSYGIFYLYLYVTPMTGNGAGDQQDSLVAFAQIVLMPGTPAVSSVTISPSSVNANSNATVPIVFTGNWTGGTAPYSYVWMVTYKDTIQTPYILQFTSYNYTSKNSATFSFVPSDNGRYYVYLFVGSTSSAAYVMAVSQVDSKRNPEPTVSQVTLTPTTVDSNVGEILNFNANWTGGISPYTYVWYVTSNFPHWQKGFGSFSSENSTSVPTASFTYIPKTYGIYYLYLFVNNYVGTNPPTDDEDQDDGFAIVTTAEIIVLHPPQPLSSSAISISPTVTTVGSPINATVESGYGVAPFSYSWAVTTSSGQPATGDYTTSANQIIFNTAGTYTVTVTVTDANGVTASLTETVTINSPLGATISVSGLTTLDSGQSATLVLNSVVGGIPPYKGQWLEEPPLASTFFNLTSQFYISTTDLSAASVSTGILTTTGSWTFEFEITDSTSTTATSAPVTITVNPALSVSLSSPIGTQIGAGSSITFTNITQGGTAPYTYSYSVSPSTGWTQSSYPGNTFTFTSTGSYIVTLSVQDAANSIVSSSLTVTVVSPLTVQVQPQSYSIDPGQAFIALTTSVEYGSGSYTWQWYYVSPSGSPGSGVAITGSSGSGATATYTPAQNGTYYVVFKDSSGQSVTTNGAVVKKNQSPTVSVLPSSPTIDTSQTLVLTSSVTGGSGSFSYSWTIGGSQTVVGTATTFSFTEATAGTYKVWLSVTDTGTSPYYSLSPVSISITVDSSPTVTVSPASATIDLSQSLLLTATVNGGSGLYSYSWTIGGSSSIVGTSSTFSFAGSSAKTYIVWLNVTDTGTYSPLVVSAKVSIVVNVSPSVSVQPQSATIDSGQSITITSTAVGGTGPFSWQWYDSSGTISGASGTGLTASQTFSSADTGIYVVFTDTGTTSGASPTATADSLFVTVTVDGALTISAQPSSFTINSGQSVTLTSTVSGGTGTFSWSLYTSINTLVTSGTGATASYQLSPTTTTSYYFVFTDTGISSGATPVATVTSNYGKVTVNSAPTVTVTPSSAIMDTGQSVTLVSVVTGGSGSFTYSWSINGSSVVVGMSPSYTFSLATPNTYKVWLNVTDTGTTPSYALSPVSVAITVESALSISAQPTSAIIDSGQSISPTSTVSGGTGKYSWQWYDSSGSITGDSGTGPVATATFSSGDTGIYVMFTDTGTSSAAKSSSTVKSSVVTVTLDSALSIFVQPLPGTIDSSQSITLTSTVTGGTGTYSWSLYTSSDFLITSGTGSKASYLLSPTTTTSYYFVFTDTGVTSGATPASTSTSHNALVTVNPPLSPSVSPSSATLTLGQSQTFTSTTSGGSGQYSYSWTTSGSATVVSTTNAYTFSKSSTGSYKIWLNVTDVGTTSPYTLSVSVAVQVNPGTLSVTFVTNTPSSGSGSLDVGQSLSLSVTPTISGGVLPYSYQWYLNGTSSSSKVGLSGTATSGSAINYLFAPAGKGTYLFFLQISSSDGQSSTSGAITITVFLAPSISTQPSSVIIDSGQSITITTTAAGGTGSFAWQWYDSSGAITGDSGTTSTASATFSKADTGIYVVFTDTGTFSGASPTITVTSSKVSVTVDSTLAISVQPNSTTINSGQSVTLTSTVTGGTGTFSWSLYTTLNTFVISGKGQTASYQLSPTANTTYYFIFTDTGVTSGATPTATVTSNQATITVIVKPTVTITPSSSQIDVGQTILLTSSVSGGSNSFSYSWSIGGSSTIVGKKISYSFTGSSASAYKIYLNVTDNSTQYVFSATASVVVNPSLSISVQPTSVIVDAGQSVTLSSTVAGGTGTFSWSLYTSSNSLVTSGTGKVASYVFNPQSNGSYYFVFADSGVTSGASPLSTAKSNSASVVVNSDPKVTVLSTTVGSGSSATLTATASGGTGAGYAFKWYSNSALTNLLYSGNPFKTPSLTSTTTYYVTVVDSTGTVSSPASVTVTVVSSLTSSSLTVTPTTTDVGFAVSVNVSSGAGVPPYSYSWTVTLYPSGSASGYYSTSGNKVTFTKTGTYSVTATVRDSAGETASITKTITVNALPSVTITPSSATIDVGASVTFSNSSTGGTAPITYGWGYPSGSGITRAGNLFNFTNTGNFTIKLYVNDSLGASSFAIATISVNSQPIIVYSSLNVTISAAATMDSGTSTNVGITSISGTGPYTAQLKAEAPGSTTFSVIATTAQFNTFPENVATGSLTTVGQWHFIIVATEVSNTAISGTSSPITINVVNALASSALSISPTNPDIGSPVSVSVQSGYGTSPFLYTWTVTLSGGGSASGDYTTSGNQITFSAGGTYSVAVKVVDADGLSASISTTITVNAPLTVTIYASTPTTVDKGQTVTFSNSVSGGTGVYAVSYSVSSLGGGIKFGAYSVSGNTITFSLTGQYEVSSIVTDSQNDTVTSGNSITVTVNALPTVSISPSSTTIDTGNSVTFTNTTVNGTQPYTYIWSYPSGQGITQAGNTFTFADTGNFTITLTVVDSVGVVASSSALITVNPSPIIVLQPGSSSGVHSATNSSQYSSGLQPLIQEQKKTFGGSSDPTVTLDNGTPWAVYVQAGTGTPPFTFTWTILYSSNSTPAKDYTLGSSNSTYVDNVLTFTGTGNYSVTIKVQDKYGSTSTESVTVGVNSLLVVSVAIQATESSFDVGNSTTLSSTPTISGGTSPYSYQWYRNGTSSGDKISGASGSVTNGQLLDLSQNLTVPGNYTYYLVISDSAYSPGSNSAHLLITVNRLPITSSIVISPTSTVIDGLINATVKPGYGTAPFNYTWTVAPENGSSSPMTYYGHQIGLSQSGNYSVSLKLRDSDGRVAYNNTTVKIYSSSLVIVKITSPSSVPTIDAGQSQSITGSFVGGSGSYEYQWVLQNSSTPSAPNTGYTSGASPQSYTFTSSTSGTFYVFLYVKDTIVGDTGDVYQEVKVNSDIAQSSISISPTTTSVGTPVVASVESGYGTPPLSYSWTVTLSNGGSATGDYNISGNQVTFSKSGNYTVKVAVSDSYSSATSSNYNVAVSAIVSLTASISSYPSAGVTAMDINHAQVFKATVLGGTGSYSYSWGIGGVSGTVGTSSTYSLNVSTPGLYIIWLNVTEGTSHASASPLTIIVNPLPKAFFGVTGTIQTDVGQSINGNAVDGTPPYHYSWLVTLYPSGGSAAGDYTVSGTSITFSAKGNYTVEFIVTDADSATASVTATFVVNNQLYGSLSLSNPLSSVIDRGNSSLLDISITGGSGAFSYQWYVQLPGTTSFQVVTGAVNSTYNFATSSLTQPGIYLFYVNVTDTNTDPAYVHSNIISVTVLAKIIYGVTFYESGLPQGMKWYLNITNGSTYSTVSNNITFLEPNGTYSYSISTGNKTYRLSQSTTSFSFIISGDAISQSLSFVPVVYSVTFSESGLKPGTEWFVNLTNGQSGNSTLSTITFSLPNGTYHYSIATVNKQYKPNQTSTSFVVVGGSLSESIPFILLNYSVTFNVLKLPSGTEWFVNLSDGQSYSSNGFSLSFVEPNGTYFYTIASSNKIYSSPGGKFIVSGKSITTNITFSPRYFLISFEETGLQSGTEWSITLVNASAIQNKSSTGSISFEEVNGTYNFTIVGIAGYKTQDYQITVVVNGSNFKDTIAWTAVTYPVTVTETGLATGATWSVTLTTLTQGGQENVQTINSTTDSITFYVTNGSYSYVVTLPQGYQGTPVKASITVVGDAVTTNLKVTPLPNYLLISIIIAAIAVIVVVLFFYIMAGRKSLFKRDGSLLKVKKVKGNK